MADKPIIISIWAYCVFIYCSFSNTFVYLSKFHQIYKQKIHFFKKERADSFNVKIKLNKYRKLN